MSTELVSIDLGQCSFETTDKSMRVDSRCTAVIRPETSSIPFQPSIDTINLNSLDHDYWIPRTQRFDAAFEVSLSSEQHLSRSERSSSVKMLKQSLIMTELWQQLGLHVSQITDNVNSLDDYATRCVTLSLSDARRFHRDQNNTNNIRDDVDAINNLRPPRIIPPYRFVSTRISLHLTSTGTRRCGEIGRKMTEKCPTTLSYIRLMDAALRSAVSRLPKRLLGVRSLLSQQNLSLATLAPSTFMPGYVDLLAGRASLIEPIARLLHDFKERVASDPWQFGRDRDNASRSQNTSEHWRSEIEGNLWTTMANILKDQQNGRRLKPLKQVLIGTTTSSVGDFEDLATSSLGPQVSMSCDNDVMHDVAPFDALDADREVRWSSRVQAKRCTSTIRHTDSEWRDLLIESQSPVDIGASPGFQARELRERDAWWQNYDVPCRTQDSDECVEISLEELYGHGEEVQAGETSEFELLFKETEHSTHHPDMMVRLPGTEASSMLI